jgi:hypothetical protein
MSERDRSWFISQDVPEWIMKVERDLEATIPDHLEWN